MSELEQALELPSFDRPPVREVALAIRFDDLPLQLNNLVQLWTRLSDRFPKVEQQPPLPPTPPEDLTGASKGGVHVSMATQLPLPRFWLVSESGNEICQIQHDRLIVNWRRVEDDDVYPRYDHVRELLQTCLSAFIELLQSEEIGEVRPFQAEVDYVNQLDIGTGWEDLDDLGRVFSFWNDSFRDQGLPTPTNARAGVRFVVPDTDNPRGVLHLDVTSARRDDLRVLNMALRSRVPITEPNIETAMDAVDFGRTWVVKSFALVTTTAMHEIWGRTR